MRVIVKSFTKDFYHRDILVFDEKQVRMNDPKVKESIDGIRVYPSDFPEAEFFAFEIKWD